MKNTLRNLGIGLFLTGGIAYAAEMVPSGGSSPIWAQILTAIQGALTGQGSHGVDIGAVEGVTNVGTAPTDFPLYEGGLANNVAEPTPVTAGQKVAAWFDLVGRFVTSPYAAVGLQWSTSAVITTTTNTTLLAANATYKTKLTDIECWSVSTTAGTQLATITDTASNVLAVLALPNVGDGSANNRSYQIPRKTSATNSALTVTEGGTAGSISCTASGFYGS